MHAVVPKSNVKEIRLSACAVLHSTIMRPFNQSSVEAKRSTIDNTKDKEKVKRVKVRQRVQMVSEYVSDLNWDIENAMADIDRDLWKHVLLDMSSNKDEASAIELQQEINKYEQGIKKKRQWRNRKKIQTAC